MKRINKFLVSFLAVFVIFLFPVVNAEEGNFENFTNFNVQFVNNNDGTTNMTITFDYLKDLDAVPYISAFVGNQSVRVAYQGREPIKGNTAYFLINNVPSEAAAIVDIDFYAKDGKTEFVKYRLERGQYLLEDYSSYINPEKAFITRFNEKYEGIYTIESYLGAQYVAGFMVKFTQNVGMPVFIEMDNYISNADIEVVIDYMMRTTLEAIQSYQSGVITNNPEYNILTKNIIQEIKESARKVEVNVENDSWIFDGAMIQDTDYDIDLTITKDSSEHQNEIKELLNNNDTVYILDFNYSGNLPEGTNVKIDVSNKYDKYTIVKLYYYNPTTNEVEGASGNLAVKDGYVTFGLEHCSEYALDKVDIQKGDVDYDGYINATDAAIVLDCFKNNDADELSYFLGDMNTDNYLNSTDSALILDLFKVN